MYEELVKRLRKRAVNLKEKFSRNAELLSELMQAADALEELSRAQERWITQERNAMLKSIPRWIPVEERLPEKNGYYLTYVESALFPNSYYFNLIKFIDGDFIEDHCVIHRVTHWMPLPEPPEEQE